MAVDHVIPKQLAEHLGIPRDFWNDYANCVLACSGCNGFCNQAYRNPEDAPTPEGDVANNEQAFFDYRDAVFKDRYWKIGQRRMKEMMYFDQRPWEQGQQPDE